MEFATQICSHSSGNRRGLLTILVNLNSMFAILTDFHLKLEWWSSSTEGVVYTLVEDVVLTCLVNVMLMFM